MKKMKAPQIVTGTVKRHPDGFGFLVPDQADIPDLFIPRHSMEGVMTNDKVAARVERESGSQRLRGEILRIEARGCEQVVGIVDRNPVDGRFFLKDTGGAWGQNLLVDQARSLVSFSAGQFVTVRITQYPENRKALQGFVVKVLNDHLSPLNDIERVASTLTIPWDFSKACLEQAREFSPLVNPNDHKDRTDLRHLPFVTIDGATAKDFDDAVFVEPSKGRGFVLWVAIADVSHYVKVGSAIDKDAFERGTSVYFPNFVIPMLPEVLSNELCSLKPKVPRLALVARMEFDSQGVPQRAEFLEAIIQSHARLTYGEVQEFLDGGAPTANLAPLAQHLQLANDCAKILLQRRKSEGALELDLPEITLLIDDEGEPIDIVKTERLFAHRLIEEFMLAANVAVAQEFSRREVPAIYRIHELPNEEALLMLHKYLQMFGARIDLRGGQLQKQLSKALAQFEGTPQAAVLNMLTLRAMAQAKYSENNVGHFGLGFDNYTHFTSPIRRYPDLIVHRLLKNVALGKKNYRLMSEEDLAQAGVVLSAAEQRAVKAERQIQAIKKARLMSQHVGSEFEGVVSSVTKFGLFVVLRRFEIDGLIHIDQLPSGPGDRWQFDETNLSLVAARSGRRFSLGDTVHILVTKADIESGKIDFILAREERPTQKLGAKPIVKSNSAPHRGRQRPAKKNKGGKTEGQPKNKPVEKKVEEKKPKPRTLLDFLNANRKTNPDTKKTGGGTRPRKKSKGRR